MLVDIYTHLAHKKVEEIGSTFKGNILHHSVKFFELAACLFYFFIFFLLGVHFFKGNARPMLQKT